LNVLDLGTLSSVAIGTTFNLGACCVKGLSGHKGLIQVTKSGTNTVKLEGRCTPTAPWIDLVAALAAGLTEQNLMPEMRLNCTAWTSGSCQVYLLLARK
jgi:hypothetical protein